MNIVYGGSFNPITIGHKMIVEYLITKYKPKNFIIVPVGDYYIKKNNLVNVKIRINMLNLAFKNLNVIISDIEANQQVYLGTYDLLQKLNYEDIHFIMGADNLVTIRSWINSEKLLNGYKFIIITRNNIDVLDYINSNLGEYKNNFIIENLNIDINSTKIRNNIVENSHLLDKDVYDYIINNEIYK